MVLPKAGGEALTFLQTSIAEAHGQFAPNGRWIAYSSDDRGTREIYVQAFTPGQKASGARWQVSTGGGTMPRWRGDGKELFYPSLDGKMMVVRVDIGGTAFQASAPVVLFSATPPTLRTPSFDYDVTRDGQRFLLIEPVEKAESQPLTLVTDWLTMFKR